MPPTARAPQDRKPKAAAATERLAAEATPPDGAALLVPLLALDRRRRAQVIRGITTVMTTAQSLGLVDADTDDATEAAEAAPEATFADLSEQVAVLDVLADAEDVLTTAAQQAVTFTAWAKAASDRALVELFAWYGGQMGEALASPS